MRGEDAERKLKGHCAGVRSQRGYLLVVVLGVLTVHASVSSTANGGRSSIHTEDSLSSTAKHLAEHPAHRRASGVTG